MSFCREFIRIKARLSRDSRSAEGSRSESGSIFCISGLQEGAVDNLLVILKQKGGYLYR